MGRIPVGPASQLRHLRSNWHIEGIVSTPASVVVVLVVGDTTRDIRPPRPSETIGALMRGGLVVVVVDDDTET